MFQLTAEEAALLRSQFGTLKSGRGEHRKYQPYAFTEQGVAMLSSVLRSARAVRVSLRRLLDSINERIAYLFDRDHQIGQAYLIGVIDFGGLVDVLRYKVIPLLQEYFYEDWSKIQLVFGDSRGTDRRAVQPQIIEHDELRGKTVFGFEDDDLEPKRRFRVAQVISPLAVRKVYEGVASSPED